MLLNLFYFLPSGQIGGIFEVFRYGFEGMRVVIRSFVFKSNLILIIVIDIALRLTSYISI